MTCCPRALRKPELSQEAKLYEAAYVNKPNTRFLFARGKSELEQVVDLTGKGTAAVVAGVAAPEAAYACLTNLAGCVETFLVGAEIAAGIGTGAVFPSPLNPPGVAGKAHQAY